MAGRPERAHSTSQPLLEHALSEAEQARYAPSLKDRGIDPPAARQVAQVRDELCRIARRWPAGEPPVYHPGEDYEFLGGTDAASGELLYLSGSATARLRVDVKVDTRE